MTNKKFTVSESDMIDILNMLTYDDYASLQRRLWRAGIMRRPLFVEYVAECKKTVRLDSIHPAAWYAGYMVIADLFEDNERFGTPCDKEALIEHDIDEVVKLFDKYKY